MIGDRNNSRKVGGGGGRASSSSTSGSVSSGSVMFPFFTNMYSSASKAEQILSRYRPIAPKPPSGPPSKPDGDSSSPASAPATTNLQSSSSASVGSRKGSRKRPGDNSSSLLSPRSYKRAALNNRKQQQQQQQQPQQVNQESVCGGIVSRISPTSRASQTQQVPQQLVPVMVAGNEIGSLSSTVTTSVSMTSSDPAQTLQEQGPWKVLRSPNPRSSPNPASLDTRSCNSRSEFLYPPRRNVQNPPPAAAAAGAAAAAPLPIAPQHPVEQQHSKRVDEDDDDDDWPKLVTLSLLPDTPAQLSEPCITATTNSSSCDLGLRFRDENKLELSLGASCCSVPPRYTAKEPGVPPRYAEQQRRRQIHQHPGFSSLIDTGYLEQAYGGSSDPVVLMTTTGEANSGSVLWSNLSYNKVMSERMSGKRAAGPYIDPLGLPTQLGCFRFRLRSGAECSAVLWGFLKKFMLFDSNVIASTDPSELPAEQSSVQMLPDHQQQQQVIIPQPVRPNAGAGSVVRLEMVSEMNCYSGGLTGSLESIEAQLENSGTPAFVTDRSNRVRWVSRGYNQLVGTQPSVSPQAQQQHQQHQQRVNYHRESSQDHFPQHLATNLCRSEESSSSCIGDREVIFHCDRSPYSALTLAGLVRVDWLDSGKRCCLTGVSCEMRRLDDPHYGSLFIWKLNLNVDNIRGGGSIRG